MSPLFLSYFKDEGGTPQTKRTNIPEPDPWAAVNCFAFCSFK